MIFPSLILGFVLLMGVLWALLERHERRRVADGLTRHGPLRLLIAAFGLLLFLFAGGCAALFAYNMDGIYVTLQSIGILAGPPLLVGFLIAWAAMRRRRAL